MSSSFIAGLGAWYPSRIRRNSEWPEDFGRACRAGDRTFNDIPSSGGTAAAITEQYLQAEALDPFLGAKERRVADDEHTAVEAEFRAAESALMDAELEPEALDAIISYSMVPDRLMPGSAAGVAHRLGAEGAMSFNVEAACATLIPQLATAAGLIESGTADNVLITQSHLLLRAFPLTHPAAPGLGDAATALVVSRRGRWRILGTHQQTHGQFADAVTWVREEEKPWYEKGGSYRLGSLNRPQAKQLMRDTVDYGAQTVQEVAAKSGVDVERVAHLFSVQPRGWIPGAIARCLGLPPEIAGTTYEKYAHVGACGPIANWHAAHENGALRDESHGSLIALYAQGAGFTRGAALIGMD